MEKFNILVIEDEYNQRMLLSEMLSKEGYTVFEAENGEMAKEIYKNEIIDLILLDFKLPDVDGITLMEYFKSINPETEIIMITAYGSIEHAVNALKRGASDYLTKPIDFDDLLIKIKKLEEKKELIRENIILKEVLTEKLKFEDFVYRSEKMQNIASLVVRVAKADSTCLITGESGTGKEIIANLIHNLSLRRDKPLIKVNCSAIPEQLLESELFGYEKGAFTGATQRKLGKFELADKGSIFLDEIGDMPLFLQAKLLRVLQEKEIERLGGVKPIKVDIRIIAATNKNLEEEVKKGNFREDLFYRINVVRIEIPPLRERKEDIPALIDFFIKKYADRYSREIKGITKEARDALIKYDYPGNVRELENMIERAVVLARGEFLTFRDFFFNESLKDTNRSGNVKEVISTVEKDMILEALIKNNWIQTRAATSLGISERMLRYKMNKYGIKKR